MTIREFVKGIIENLFTDAEIIKYCKALDSELLADLLKELWAEYVSCDYVGELSNAQRLKNAYDLICERFNVNPWEEQPEPQQGKTDSEQTTDTQSEGAKPKLPDELNNETAMRYFEEAIKKGLMDENFKWLSGKQMLACFAREMSLKLGLSYDYERISWKPFEELFGIEKGKLRQNYSDIQKTGQTPKKIYLIDQIFE